MRQKERCAVSLSAESRGCLQAPIRAAVIYTLIGTAKLNDVDPQAWLADVLARIADHTAHRLEHLLPWHWKAERLSKAA
jgi:hypothetical protein